MKNRMVPYGYKYQNGSIIIDKSEQCVLLKIFEFYLEGSSLLNISKFLNDEKIEYMPNTYGWNKSRIMRIIEDKRYIGDETYPQIISPNYHNMMMELKYKKNTQKYTDRTSDIFNIKVPVFCPSCGSQMLRRHWSDTRFKDKWCCKNEDCGKEICIENELLIIKLTELLNHVIKNPQIIKNEINDAEVDMDVLKIENDINQALDSNNFDKDELRQKILKCVKLKYRALGSNSAITKKLKTDFEKASSISSFSPDFFNSTVKHIIFNENGDVGLVLINGQKIEEVQ